MKVKYTTIMKVEVEHTVDTLKEIKADREFANDLAHMICDEATTAGGVATYKIYESTVNVSLN